MEGKPIREMADWKSIVVYSLMTALFLTCAETNTKQEGRDMKACTTTHSSGTVSLSNDCYMAREMVVYERNRTQQESELPIRYLIAIPYNIATREAQRLPMRPVV